MFDSLVKTTKRLNTEITVASHIAPKKVFIHNISGLFDEAYC
jgi:hypothetical protein